MATAGPARTADIEELLRRRIMADPGVVLDDAEIMRALAEAADNGRGGNVVDLRGMAMERLESRLARLEETHRAVIAAAYENLSSTNQVQRAALRLLDETEFEGFLAALAGDVAGILRVDSVRLVLESPQRAEDAGLGRLRHVLQVAPPGFVSEVMNAGRTPSRRHIVLRQTLAGAPELHGARAEDIRSEVLMRLDLGEGRLPGMLVMGAEDPHQFRPGQGTDLLAFFAGVFERAMRRWLA